MSPIMRLGGKFNGFILATLSALLLSCCFFPVGLWNHLRAFAAWFALAPLFVALSPEEPRSLRHTAGIGYLFGLLLHLVGAYWLNSIGTVPYICVAVIEALWFASFAVVYTLLTRLASPNNKQQTFPLIFATLWVIFEWLRTQGAYAFPWFPLAATQVIDIPVLQICSVTGQWGLSLAVAWCGAGIGVVLLNPRRVFFFVSVPALVLCLHLYGLVVPSTHRTGQEVRVGVAQGSYTGTDEEGSRQTYLDLTQQAVKSAGQPLNLMVWPETVLGRLLENPDSRVEVVQAAAQLKTAILVGTERRDRDNHLYNATVLVGAHGGVRGFYDKIVIVPLGEFFPLRDLLGPIYMKYPTGTNDLTRGSQTGVLLGDSIGGDTFSFGTLICYESAFGWRAREEVLQGALFLTVSTNDLWFGVSAGPLQHADLSVLRAVETHRWIARAASSGESRIIDPVGRVVQSLPLMKRDSVSAPIILNNEKTVFVRYGDWFLVLCFFALVSGILWRKWKPIQAQTER